MAKINRFGRAFAATLLIVLAGSKSSHSFAPSQHRLAFHHGVASSQTTAKESSITTPSSFGSSSDCFSRDHKKSATSLSALHAPMVAIGLSKNLVLLKDASGPLVSILEAGPDAQAEALLDISHVFLDFTAFFKFNGRFLNYAQLVGRLSFIAIDFLPGHAFHVEEMAVQLFLLGLSVRRMAPKKQPKEEEAPMPDPNEIMMWQQEQHQRFLDLEKQQQQQQQQQREAAPFGSRNEPSYGQKIHVLAWKEAAISDFAPPFLAKKNN
jgi:hypothetical protein